MKENNAKPLLLEWYCKWRSGKLTLRQLEQITGIPRSTLFRRFRREMEDGMLMVNGPSWFELVLAKTLPSEFETLKDFARRNNLTLQEALRTLGCTVKAYFEQEGKTDLQSFIRHKIN